jgi:hypothetical protein
MKPFYTDILKRKSMEGNLTERQLWAICNYLNALMTETRYVKDMLRYKIKHLLDEHTK